MGGTEKKGGIKGKRSKKNKRPEDPKSGLGVVRD